MRFAKLISTFMKISQISNKMQEKMPILPAGKIVKENSTKFVLVNTSMLYPLVTTWFSSVLCSWSHVSFWSFPSNLVFLLVLYLALFFFFFSWKTLLLPQLQSLLLCRWLWIFPLSRELLQRAILCLPLWAGHLTQATIISHLDYCNKLLTVFLPCL